MTATEGMAMGAEWTDEFPASIVLTDENGIVISMNRRACETFAGEGGASLVGHDVRECHGDRSRSMVEELFETRRTNVYTIEKNGARKLIFQCPWYRDGAFAGYVELGLPLPAEMPHHER